MVPAVELAAEARLELRQNGSVDTTVSSSSHVHLVPRDLVDHGHGPLGVEVVEGLPLPDALRLDGQGRDLGEPARELADDGDVRRRQPGGCLGGHGRLLRAQRGQQAAGEVDRGPRVGGVAVGADLGRELGGDRGPADEHPGGDARGPHGLDHGAHAGHGRGQQRRHPDQVGIVLDGGVHEPLRRGR